MGDSENIKIFQDTEKLYRSHRRLAEAVENSIRDQQIVPENMVFSAGELKKYDRPAQIKVSRKRSFEAASAYKRSEEEMSKVCVLNFASATNPGGGVVHGSRAQEESLCRCSTLYPNLNTRRMWDHFYTPHRRQSDPLHSDDCIYTPGVIVFKSDTAQPETMPEQDWYTVNVITCAAPNLRDIPALRFNPGEAREAARLSEEELLRLHEKRMRRILDIASAKENEVVIAGAFGCGAFENPPEIVAQAVKNILPDYLYAFRTLEFAIYCSPIHEKNFTSFTETLWEYL